MPHLNEDGAGNEDASIDFTESLRVSEENEVIQRTGIGDNDHADDYRPFAVSTRSSVAMSLSRSSTV